MINTGLRWLCLRPCWYLLDLSQQYCFKNKGVFTFPCAKNSWQVTDVSVFCCLVLFFLRDQLNFHQDGPSILVPIYTVLFFLSPIYFRLMGLMFKWFGMLNKRVPVGAPFWTFDIFTLIWSHVDPEAHWQFEPYQHHLLCSRGHILFPCSSTFSMAILCNPLNMHLLFHECSISRF